MTTIDSLKLLTSQSKDSTLADIYNQLSWNYRNINLDSSSYYAQKGIDLSNKINYKNGLSHGLNYLGIAKRNQSLYSEAMAQFFKALKVSEQIGNETQISYTLINIGNIYLYQSNFEGAIQYFERSLENSIMLNNKRLMAYSHINIGRSYIGLKQHKKANIHLQKTIDIRMSLGDEEGVTIANVELADVYLLLGKADKAISILLKNISSIDSLGQKNTLAYSYISMAKAYMAKQEFSKAFSYVQNGLELSKNQSFKNAEIQGLKVLAQVYEGKKDPNNALQTYKTYLCKKDSIFNAENTRKIETIFSKYISEKSDSEKLKLKEQTEHSESVIKRQRVIIILAAVSAVLFLFIAAMAYKSSMVRQHLNEQIQKEKDKAYRHNNDLIDINNEKNNLIRILSHDLRAPINNVKGLIQIHQLDHKKDFSESENQVLNLIKSESDRLLNMIKKILNVEALDDDKTEMKYEKINISSIVNETVVSFQSAALSKNITIDSKLPHKPVYITGDEIHLHQVIENLLSNAIKFSEKGRKIHLEVLNISDKVRLSVADEGPGLTKEDEEKIFKKFQTLSAKPTGDEESTGLGLSIVKRYVKEMKGRVWYESTYGHGTTFYVEFDKC